MSCCCLSNKLVTLHVFFLITKIVQPPKVLKISHEIHRTFSPTNNTLKPSPQRCYLQVHMERCWGLQVGDRSDLGPMDSHWRMARTIFQGSPNGPFGSFWCNFYVTQLFPINIWFSGKGLCLKGKYYWRYIPCFFTYLGFVFDDFSWIRPWDASLSFTTIWGTCFISFRVS